MVLLLVLLKLPDDAVQVRVERVARGHVEVGVEAERDPPGRGLGVDAGQRPVVDDLDHCLQQHFPAVPGVANPNELPDQPLVG